MSRTEEAHGVEMRSTTRLDLSGDFCLDMPNHAKKDRNKISITAAAIPRHHAWLTCGVYGNAGSLTSIIQLVTSIL